MKNEKKWIILVIYIAFSCLTYGCSNISENQVDELDETPYINLDYLSSATTSVVNDSVTSISISIATTYNGNNECSLDEWFVIEVNKNNKWYTLPYINQGTEFIDMGYIIDESGTRQMDYNWEEIYGTLPEGDYRIITRITEIENTIYTKYFISTPFKIN